MHNKEADTVGFVFSIANTVAKHHTVAQPRFVQLCAERYIKTQWIQTGTGRQSHHWLQSFETSGINIVAGSFSRTSLARQFVRLNLIGLHGGPEVHDGKL